MGDEITDSKYKESCQYFPNENTPEIVIEYPGGNKTTTITIDNSKTVKDEHTTRRFFNIVCEYKPEGDSPSVKMNHSVSHIHYRSWVDMSIP